MSGIATVFGGSGFVGRYIVQQLAKSGWRVRVASRRSNEASFVRVYGHPGQIEPIFANIRNDQSVADAISGADVVVNCVGILVETSKQRFDDVHFESARRIAETAATCHVKRLVHISSIGANAESASRYARSKGLGEKAIMEAFPAAVILRPSIVFGQEDQFFNKFAAMTRLSPVIPTVSGKTLFQAVYVGDIAKATCRAIEDKSVSGVYELGGPDILSFGDLMVKMLDVIRRRRFVLDLPLPVARLNARIFDLLQTISGHLVINRLITRDQIKQLMINNIVSEGAQSFHDLEIEPVSLDTILDTYLYRFRPAGQYTEIQESANVQGDSEVS